MDTGLDRLIISDKRAVYTYQLLPTAYIYFNFFANFV